MFLSGRLTSLFSLFFIIFSFLALPSMLFSSQTDEDSSEEEKFNLVIQEDRISLTAHNISLKKIIEKIGSRMDIEVDARISADEKVTEKFYGLSLKDALDRLSVNYVYLLDSGEENGKIKKIVLLSRGGDGKGVMLSRPAHPSQSRKAEDRPEPFKFEFDPSKFMKDGR